MLNLHSGGKKGNKIRYISVEGLVSKGLSLPLPPSISQLLCVAAPQHNLQIYIRREGRTVPLSEPGPRAKGLWGWPQVCACLYTKSLFRYHSLLLTLTQNFLYPSLPMLSTILSLLSLGPPFLSGALLFQPPIFSDTGWQSTLLPTLRKSKGD